MINSVMLGLKVRQYKFQRFKQISEVHCSENNQCKLSKFLLGEKSGLQLHDS